MTSVVERLGSTTDDRFDDAPARRELARELTRVKVRELSARLRFLLRRLLSLVDRREKRAPMGKTLAAIMPTFCSKTANRLAQNVSKM
jgi:hypothetical protein